MTTARRTDASAIGHGIEKNSTRCTPTNGSIDSAAAAPERSADPHVTEEIASKQHLLGDARLREQARQKRESSPGKRQVVSPVPTRTDEAQHEQQQRGAAGDDDARRRAAVRGPVVEQPVPPRPT